MPLEAPVMGLAQAFGFVLFVAARGNAAEALILFVSHAVVPRTNNGLVRARIVLTHVVGSLILASACPFLGFFPRFLSVTATLDAVFVNPRAKQLEIAVFVAAALFQRNHMVAIVIHANQSTAGTGELVALHDAPPCSHP